jgi:hypothetical protein
VALVVALVGVAAIGWLLRGDGETEARPPRLVLRDREAGGPARNGAPRAQQDPAERT